MIEIAENKDGKIETADDAVNHPSHYNIGNIEAIIGIWISVSEVP